MRPELLNPLVLAYLGDSVLELRIRKYLILKTDLGKVNEMQKEALSYVSAKSHYTFMQAYTTNGFFDDLELSIYYRGRNIKGSKKETREHHHSTGLEAIIGYHYLMNNDQRIDEIVLKMLEFLG